MKTLMLLPLLASAFWDDPDFRVPIITFTIVGIIIWMFLIAGHLNQIRIYSKLCAEILARMEYDSRKRAEQAEAEKGP